jgi:hypothetical protein
MALINISICLSDVPKDKIKQATNGKKYLNLVVAERKETSQYGETHTVFISQDKVEREAKKDKCYIGGGKEFKQVVTVVTVEEVDNMPVAEDFNDLPFILTIPIALGFLLQFII